MTTQPPAPTLTPATDANPSPRVEVLISPMPTDARTVSIWRSYGGVIEAVRGAVNATCSGDFLVTDYEAPLGQAIIYSCQTFDSAGTPSPLSDPSASVTLDVADVWLSDPLDPSTSMAWPVKRGGDLFLRLGSFTGQQYLADQTVVGILGSSLPIGMGGVRQAVSQLPIVLATQTASAAVAVKALLARSPLCMRVPPSVVLLDPVAYVQTPSVVPSVFPDGVRIEWTLALTAVRAPGLNVVIPTRTYDDLLAEASTYDELAQLYATYIDLQRGN